MITRAKHHELANELANLKRENETLKEENALLKEQLAKMEAEKVMLQMHQGVPNMEWWISRRDRRRQLATQLPDLVLKALFRQMTPADQMAASETCSRWSGLVFEVTRLRRSLALILDRTDSRRTSLADAEATFNRLSYGEDWPFLKSLPKADGKSMYPGLCSKWNSLQLDEPSEDLFKSITTTFPGIKKLLFCRKWQEEKVEHYYTGIRSVYNISVYGHLARYLTHWSSQLTALHLALFEIHPKGRRDGDDNYSEYSEVENSDSDDQFSEYSVWRHKNLATAINSLSTLKHLTIKVDGLPLPNLPILGQLDEFNCDANWADFLKQLQRHGQVMDKPTRIVYVGNLHENQIGSLPETMRSRFVRLDVANLNLPTTCNYFPSLTSLQITIKTAITVNEFFRLLSQLNQLAFLHLHKCLFLIDADSQPNRLLVLHQINSLKVFRLTNPISSHLDLQLLNIPWTMPNVEVLQLDFVDYRSHCIDCDLAHPFISAFRRNPDVGKACLRQLFGPLKTGCTKLRLLGHNREDVFGSVNELLALQ